MDFRSFGDQRFGKRGLHGIVSGNRFSLLYKIPGKVTHADTADTDKVY